MLAVSDADVDGPSTFVVDCGGDVVQRLLQCGVSPERIAALCVTHRHPDHVSGFPLFMEKIWLAGRERSIPVCGIKSALDQTRRSWEAFEPVHRDWDVPPIDWTEVDHAPDTPLWSAHPWNVVASPVDHGETPNVGLRIEHVPTGRVVAYSCDTAPTDAVTELARDADILVHEANGIGDGHSTAEDAAFIAARAGVKRLLLVHLPPGDKSEALADARHVFSETDLGEEAGSYAI